MKRHSALVPLSREHHDVLILAQLLKTDVPDYKGMPTNPAEKLSMLKEKFETVMKPHFILEEKIAAEIKGHNEDVDNISNEIIKEHELIEKATSEAEQSKDLIKSLDEIGRMMEAHIRKEERQWFELIQEKLGEKYLKKIVKL